MSTNIKIFLPDGSEKSLPANSTGFDLANSIGKGLARSAVAYKVDERVSPINHYGYTKALGEKLILNSAENKDNFIILRTSWVISSKGKNFVLTIIFNN